MYDVNGEKKFTESRDGQKRGTGSAPAPALPSATPGLRPGKPLRDLPGGTAETSAREKAAAPGLAPGKNLGDPIARPGENAPGFAAVAPLSP